jgi:hypothetical protein
MNLRSLLFRINHQNSLRHSCCRTKARYPAINPIGEPSLTSHPDEAYLYRMAKSNSSVIRGSSGSKVPNWNYYKRFTIMDCLKVMVSKWDYHLSK